MSLEDIQREFGIYKYSNGSADSLDEETMDPNTVNQNDVNHIEGVCSGDNIDTASKRASVIASTRFRLSQRSCRLDGANRFQRRSGSRCAV